MTKILDTLISKGIRYTIFTLLVIIAALFFVLLFLREQGKVLRSSIARPVQTYDKSLMAGVLRTGDSDTVLKIPVAIADTPAERQQGLSGTQSLPQDSGMLFVFDTPNKPGFWMKDMKYGLDFVWLDSAMKIIDITHNVMPNTYPKVFYCSQPTCPNDEVGRVQYVLEVRAGFSTAHNLKMGQTFTLLR